MTNQEILENAPIGAWCVDKTDSYFDSFGNKLNKQGDWGLSDESPVEPRCIKDIERIVELENTLHERTINASKRIVELEQVLEEICYDMECEIENKYQCLRGYASSEANRKRDLSVVVEARKALSQTKELDNG